MRICICDDERAVHGEIVRLLRENDANAAEYPVTDLYSGEALIEAYAQESPFDLIFLDVEMAAASGVDAARTVRARDKDVMIVFVSNHRKYVFDAFPVGALHYLLKPVQPEAFADVYRRAMQRYRDLHAELHLKYNGDRYTVPVREILYVEGVRRHVFFHTADGVLETVGKLSEYAPVLHANAFASPHTSFLVNLDKIVRIEKDEIVLQNGECVFCSVRCRADMLKAFDHYLGKRKW